MIEVPALPIHLEENKTKPLYSTEICTAQKHAFSQENVNIRFCHKAQH